MTLKRYCVSRATIEYSHTYIDARSEKEAIELAKMGMSASGSRADLDWKFDAYSDDGVLEDLSKGEITEYEIQSEDEIVD
jgi:hypothetical protein